MRHPKRSTVLILALAIVLCVESTHAQGKSDLSFRYSLASARSVALGDAFVADIHDASSAAWNPAVLSFLESYGVTATGGLRTDDRLLRAAITAPVAATAIHTVALGAESGVFDRADWTKRTGWMAGGEVSYALRLMNLFSIGVSYNYRTADYEGTRLSSHSGGIGLLYSVFPSLTYGVSLTGFGSGIVLKQTPEHLLVPGKESNIPRSVTFGASWRYPATHDRPVVAVYLSNQSISGEEHLVYRLGAEFFPWKFLALRGGLVSGPVTAVGRAGIGIRTGVIDIDYAVASSVAAERMHYLTVSIPLQAH